MRRTMRQSDGVMQLHISKLREIVGEIIVKAKANY